MNFSQETTKEFRNKRPGSPWPSKLFVCPFAEGRAPTPSLTHPGGAEGAGAPGRVGLRRPLPRVRLRPALPSKHHQRPRGPRQTRHRTLALPAGPQGRLPMARRNPNGASPRRSARGSPRYWSAAQPAGRLLSAPPLLARAPPPLRSGLGLVGPILPLGTGPAPEPGEFWEL